MKEYQIKVTAIDYAVEEEDLDFVEGIEDFTEEQVEAKIAEIKSELPQELMLEITCEPEDLEDMVVDAVSEETGWLNNSVGYEIISETEVDD